jgi:hypothetical protein
MYWYKIANRMGLQKIWMFTDGKARHDEIVLGLKSGLMI